jgi:hypothetical protein
MKIQPVKTDIIQQPARARRKVASDAAEAKEACGPQKAGRKDSLKEALMREPAVRPEVIERARQLAADPEYPPADVLAKVAAKFIVAAKGSR